ncbi:MAG: C69 family dipeptidase [Desulfobacterales bacterium]|nr:C69 family dipeptidase [Desulfobacterales bacterium]
MMAVNCKIFKLPLVVYSIISMLLLFSTSSFAIETESYEKGLIFGQQYQSEIRQNIDMMLKKAKETRADMQQITRYALESESLYKEILPGKVEWIQGVADGSGVAYEILMVFNSVDRMATGFIGECTTFMAHGKALASGKGVVITKNRDLGSQTLSEIGLHEAAVHPKGAIYEAAYIDIPEAEKTNKFIGSRSAGRWGYGMGVNEYQVMVADNDAPSRDMLGFKKSLHDNDLVRLVLERSKTAREGVDVIAAIVPKFGQAWNGIIFEIGDPNELWVIAITGPRWVAKKYTDTVTARSNQYQIGDDYDLAAPDLVSFAIEKGWVPAGTERIDFTKVYSTDELYPGNNELEKRKNVEKLYNTEVRYQRAMELLQAKEGKLEPKDFMAFARDHYDTYTLPGGNIIELNQTPFYSSDFVGWNEWLAYEPETEMVDRHMFIRSVCHHGVEGSTAASGIMIARPDVPNPLGVMIHAFMPPCNSLYIPFYVGVADIDNRFKGPEAAAAFQQVKARAFTQYNRYHEAIRKAFDPFEAVLFTEMARVEERFIDISNEGNFDDAVNQLTGYVKDKCVQAINLTHVAQDNITQAAKASSTWKRR